ncbi:MAG: ATPase domain-containing protein [Candidatus Thermoplasmatota archaeon]|nr:ATPase domain-containing protein [Candidatus Thermoplasmatota archaeon]
MRKIRKIPTGISGLDQMLRGGLVAGRPYSIIGGPGSGKSILGWQFLLQGVENDESTLYITLDEPHYEIRSNMDSLGIYNPNIKIMDLSPEDIKYEGEFTSLSFLDEELPKQIKKVRPLRVVLDSTTSLKAMSPDEITARRHILSLMKSLSEKEEEDRLHPPITSLLLTEQDSHHHPLESYLSRGVIRLHNSSVRDSRVRAVLIEKMRGSDFDEHMRPLRITRGGLYVADKDSLISYP